MVKQKDKDLNSDERNLFYTAYKNSISGRRSAGHNYYGIRNNFYKN